MRTLRLTSLFSALALAGAVSIAAAAGPIDRLNEKLNLSDEQTATITSLVEQHRAYMQNEVQWRDANGELNTETRGEVRAAREALHEEILTVLDADQAAKFEQMEKRRKQREGGHPRRDRIAHALAQLDLSEEQQAQIETLMDERRAQRMESRESMRSDIDAILTEDQRAQLDAMREAHREARRESGQRPARRRNG